MFPNLLNARDLGGHITTNGKQTQLKAFVRSDLPNCLTPEGVQALLDYSIRTVIDLRWPEELVDLPNPLAQQADQITYLHHSFFGESYASSDEREAAAGLPDQHLYQNMLDVFQVEIAQILRAMANAREGGILFHCKMGKDRTGVITMLLLSLVGVPQQTIIDDYVLTAIMLEEEHKRFLSQFTDPEQRMAIMKDQLCLPETALKTLDHLVVKYGGVNRYLTTIGLSAVEIESIRTRLIG